MLNFDGLDFLEFFANAINVYTGKNIICMINIIGDADIKCSELSTGSSLFDLLHFRIGWNRAVNVFPPGVVRSAGVVPFIYIYGIGAKGFYLVLYVALKAIHGSQNADNAEDTDGNAK
jgi:hypothetical protein